MKICKTSHFRCFRLKKNFPEKLEMVILFALPVCIFVQNIRKKLMILRISRKYQKTGFRHICSIFTCAGRSKKRVLALRKSVY